MLTWTILEVVVQCQARIIQYRAIANTNYVARLDDSLVFLQTQMLGIQVQQCQGTVMHAAFNRFLPKFLVIKSANKCNKELRFSEWISCPGKKETHIVRSFKISGEP